MVRKSIAVKGKAEIRKTPEFVKVMSSAFVNMAAALGSHAPSVPLEEDYLYYPRYCKRCAAEAVSRKGAKLAKGVKG